MQQNTRHVEGPVLTQDTQSSYTDTSRMLCYCVFLTSVKWPGIMQLRVSKASPDTIQFKMSHQEQSFQTLRLSQRRTVIAPLEKAYGENGLPIASAKYDDLASLCNGTHPVIRSPEHVAFYRNIRHWSNNVANNS